MGLMDLAFHRHDSSQSCLCWLLRHRPLHWRRAPNPLLTPRSKINILSCFHSAQNCPLAGHLQTLFHLARRVKCKEQSLWVSAMAMASVTNEDGSFNNFKRLILTKRWSEKGNHPMRQIKTSPQAITILFTSFDNFYFFDIHDQSLSSSSSSPQVSSLTRVTPVKSVLTLNHSLSDQCHF